MPVDAAGGCEEEAVACHGVVGAGTGQHKGVDAAKGGDHDGCGHERAAVPWQDGTQHGGGDAVLRRVGQVGEGQIAEVNEVDAEIDAGDEGTAEDERARQGAAGVTNLFRGEGDVVPGIRREERAGLGDADRDDGGEEGDGGEVLRQGGRWGVGRRSGRSWLR